MLPKALSSFVFGGLKLTKFSIVVVQWPMGIDLHAGDGSSILILIRCGGLSVVFHPGFGFREWSECFLTASLAVDPIHR